jgi:hypothetical protein
VNGCQPPLLGDEMCDEFTGGTITDNRCHKCGRFVKVPDEYEVCGDSESGPYYCQAVAACPYCSTVTYLPVEFF